MSVKFFAVQLLSLSATLSFASCALAQGTAQPQPSAEPAKTTPAQVSTPPLQLRPAELRQLQPATVPRLIPFSPTTSTDSLPQAGSDVDGAPSTPTSDPRLDRLHDPFMQHDLDNQPDPQRSKTQQQQQPANTGPSSLALPSSSDPAAPSRPFSTRPLGQEVSGSIQPPSLPQRPPIPTPPAMTLLPPRSNMHREPLSWRTRALELMNSLRGTKYSGVRLTRDFAAKPDETFAALAQACDSLSLRVESISAPAHELALRFPSQDRVVVIFVADLSTTGSSTTVAAGLLPDSKGFRTNVIDDLLDKAQTILSNKGIL